MSGRIAIEKTKHPLNTLCVILSLQSTSKRVRGQKVSNTELWLLLRPTMRLFGAKLLRLSIIFPMMHATTKCLIAGYMR